MSAQMTAEPPSDPHLFYQRVGEITRTLHEALRELGYDRELQATLGHLPDARSRLNLIARLTGDAAEKVLNTVDAAQARQDALVRQAARIDAMLDSGRPDAGALRAFTLMVRDNAAATNAQLTDIMLAQDFHDLTGQTVRKLVDLAGALEESLLKLLLEASPPPAEHAALEGPVADPSRPDVVTSQEQVDDLLESLGF